MTNLLVSVFDRAVYRFQSVRSQYSGSREKNECLIVSYLPKTFLVFSFAKNAVSKSNAQFMLKIVQFISPSILKYTFYKVRYFYLQLQIGWMKFKLFSSRRRCHSPQIPVVIKHERGCNYWRYCICLQCKFNLISFLMVGQLAVVWLDSVF